MTIVIAIALAGCGPGQPEVVVYTALDEMYSQPILQAFEDQTGIKARVQYDTEASKTTGLVTRLIAERNRPRADVFWNNEVAQTIRLKQEGILTPYQSPAAEPIPDAFKDGEGYWTGFAARARVIIYNTDLVTDPPTSIRDFAKPEWKGRAAIAKPLFGTTVTHAAALFSLWGDEAAKQYFNDLLANDVAILAGNATVRDLVVAGEFAIGWTDTDDANGAVEDGKPAKWLSPDQEADGLGTLVIPNTVAIIEGGPNPDEARQLIDYLLSPEVEAKLAASRSIQIPLNPAVDPPEKTPKLADIRATPVDWEAAADAIPRTIEFIQDEFLQ